MTVMYTGSGPGRSMPTQGTSPDFPAASEVIPSRPLHNEELIVKLAQRQSPLSSASETVSGGHGMFWNCGKARVAGTGEEGCEQKLAGLEGDHKGLKAQFKSLGLERKALGNSHQPVLSLEG